LPVQAGAYITVTSQTSRALTRGIWSRLSNEWFRKCLALPIAAAGHYS